MNSIALPQLGSGTSSIKDFVSKREKVLGVIGTALIVGGLGYFLLPVVLPHINNILQLVDTSFSFLGSILIKGVTLIVALFILMQPRVWTLGWHLFNMITRATSKVMLRIGGIERLEAYAQEYLGAKMQLVVNALNTITTERKVSEKRIAEYEDRIADAREKADAIRSKYFDKAAQQWKNPDAQSEFQKLAMQVQMWEQSLKKFRAQLKRIQLQEELCKKFQRGYGFYIDMIRSAVENLRAEWEASRGMAQASQAISSTVGEGDDFTRFFNEGVEFFQRDIARFEATVENFMTIMPEFTRGVDMAEETSEAKLLAQLETLDVTAGELLGNAEQNQRLLVEGGRDGLVSAVTQSRAAEVVRTERKQKYGSLLGGNDGSK